MQTINRSAQSRLFTYALVVQAILLLLLTTAMRAQSSGGEVTRGNFATYAAGPGLSYQISGHATMTRTADGKTIVSVHVTRLLPNTAYGVHVHNKVCGDSLGGGHYQDVVCGAVDAVNEIWPLFATNAAGIGNGEAVNAFTARPEAQAVVIHAPGGARIACADLK